MINERPKMSTDTVVYLVIGFAGTGKLTVGKELQRQLIRKGQQTRLVDNHYVNNPIFGLLDVRTRRTSRADDGFNPELEIEPACAMHSD